MVSLLTMVLWLFCFSRTVTVVVVLSGPSVPLLRTEEAEN